MKNTKITIWGWDAIEAKYQDESVVLCKYNTPLDPAADDITAERAREIAAEDPTLIWCDIDTAEPDRESLKGVLREISEGHCLANPIVAFDRSTGRWEIQSGLTDHWMAPWVILVADNPQEWAGNLFGDQDGDIHPSAALDGVDDEWLLEYAVGE